MMRVKSSTSLPVGAIWLAQMVPRSASRVAKLCTGRRSGVFFVVIFFRAEAERCAGATGLVRVGSEEHRRECPLHVEGDVVGQQRI